MPRPANASEDSLTDLERDLVLTKGKDGLAQVYACPISQNMKR